MTGQLGIELPGQQCETTALPATAHAMLALLRRHYVPDESKPAGVFAPEIQAPGPVGRRADLIWLGCTAAAGHALVGHEVKVTRADVLNELADLTKSDPWQKYCDRWYLVVPSVSLIHGLDLPESWGVLLPPSGRRTRTMTVHRAAPALRPVEQGPALKTLAAWQCWKLRDTNNRVQGLEKQCEQLRASNDQLRVTSHPTARSHTGELVARVVSALGGVGDEGIGRWPAGKVTEDEMVEALRDLQSVRGRRDEAQRTLKMTRDTLVTYQRLITNALTEVDKAGGQ